MTNGGADIASAQQRIDAPSPVVATPRQRSKMLNVVYPVAGVTVLLALWWVGGEILYRNPATRGFAGLGPMPTFQALFTMLADGTVARAAESSLYRVAIGLAWSAALGLPIGVAFGLSRAFRKASNLPFQFMRMIS